MVERPSRDVIVREGFLASSSDEEYRLHLQTRLTFLSKLLFWGFLILSVFAVVIFESSRVTTGNGRLIGVIGVIALIALIMKCLAKRPSERPASARVLADELAALLPAPDWSEAFARKWWEDHRKALAAIDSAAATRSMQAVTMQIDLDKRR